MLSLSVTIGHAIKALSCLKSSDCPTHCIGDIARCSGVPRPYLAKIINALTRAGLVTTKPGYSGGIALGSVLLVCPMRDFWNRIRREITAELSACSLAEVSRRTQQPATPDSCATSSCSRSAPATRGEAPSTSRRATKTLAVNS